ncbi:MAG: hypothetical protein HY870_21450 [Chloroflexi bacterium]|nr:hypothetical protein [Chloroflexota bacterium]
MPAPTLIEVEAIATRREPVIRNLQITQCYHELSAAVATRLGLSANWCTFATWASKQAGQSIRKEDLARTLDTLLNASTATTAAHDVLISVQRLGTQREPRYIRESVWEVVNPAAAIDRASAAVARGNQKVFEEIGREFARFCADCLSDADFNADHLAHFMAGLRPGNPPDGQRYLQQAFSRYYQAFFEGDLKARLELLLLANLEIGFHEQTRLQPEIAAAMEAAIIEPKEFTRRLLKALFPYRGWPARFRLWLTRLLTGPTPLDRAVEALLTEVRRLARVFITEHLLSIDLGGTRLKLGDDLTAEFPPELTAIAHPDLRALLDVIDPTPDSVRDSGAIDWAELADRIHFIADMFRCYAASPALFNPPFTPEQVIALKSGHVPGGPL